METKPCIVLDNRRDSCSPSRSHTPSDRGQRECSQEEQDGELLLGARDPLGEEEARKCPCQLERLLGCPRETVEAALRQVDQLLGMNDRCVDSRNGRPLMDSEGEVTPVLNEEEEEEEKSVEKILEQDTVMAKASKHKLGWGHWLVLLLLVGCASTVVGFEVAEPFSRWTILLRVVRSPLLVAYYCFLVGFNMMAWSRTGINYPRLFGFPRKGMPTPCIMFNAGSVLTSIVAVHMFVRVIAMDTRYMKYFTDKSIGISIWVCFILFLLNPSKNFIRSGRFHLITTQVRIAISPLTEVSFGDVWFADQMNSLVAVMVDIEYLFCYCIFSHTWSSADVHLGCVDNNFAIRPIVFCLPAIWRLLQCFRNAYDERVCSHLINAAKYSTTVFLVVMSTLYSSEVRTLQHTSDYRTWHWCVVVLLCFSALLKCLFCFTWDICRDWSLFHCSDKCPRSQVYYSKKWYYLAFLFNFVVRFAGALSHFVGIAHPVDGDLLFTLLVTAEVTRRFVWNFFRVEWEHIRKC